VRAIAGVAMVFLYAFASIFTVGAIAGAMAWTSRFEAGCDLCSFLQVKGHPIHPQGTDAAQEALLASSTTWEQQKAWSSDETCSSIAAFTHHVLNKWGRRWGSKRFYTQHFQVVLSKQKTLELFP
jgi:hypothetical protein